MAMINTKAEEQMLMASMVFRDTGSPDMALDITAKMKNIGTSAVIITILDLSSENDITNALTERNASYNNILSGFIDNRQYTNR